MLLGWVDWERGKRCVGCELGVGGGILGVKVQEGTG